MLEMLQTEPRCEAPLEAFRCQCRESPVPGLCLCSNKRMHYKNHLVEEKCEGLGHVRVAPQTTILNNPKILVNLFQAGIFVCQTESFHSFFFSFFLQSRLTGVCVKVCRFVHLKTAHKYRVVPLMCQTHQVLNFCTRLMMILCYSLFVSSCCCPSRSSMQLNCIHLCYPWQVFCE